MKLKITFSNEIVNKSPVTCVVWNSSEEILSCGDDNQLLRWSVTNNEVIQSIDLPKELLPTDMEMFPRTSNINKLSDIMLITGADGFFHIMNRNGRIEKTVEAHKGAVLVGRWSYDGAGLLTAGEDGQVKVWSRGGMLRSTVVTAELPIYSAAWSPDSQSILYTQGKILVIKQLAPNTKPIRWRAHDGLILCVAWNSNVNLIISGSEDCRYKVWDPQGRALFVSSNHDYPITSVSWTPQGDLFVVGAYNTLRLCDFSGWSHCLEKLDTGSIYKISWSTDGSQLAAACAGGRVIFAHLIDRYIIWKNYIVSVTEKKTINVKDVLSEMEEQLDFSERIIKIALDHDHLIVTTPIHCHIYSTSNWNTPTIFDLKDGTVNHILLSEKYLCIVERTSVNIYNYQGRLIASPRWNAMNPEALNINQISLSSDTLGICDQTDSKCVNLFELGSNRSIQESINTIQHSSQITQIALNQAGSITDRQMALIDKNKDLFLVTIKSASKVFTKIGGQMQSVCWHSEYNMLSAIQDIKLMVWYCPEAARIGPQLLKMSSLQYDSAELGRGPRVISFNESSVSVRRTDGSLLNIPVSPYPAILHEHVMAGKWNDAIKHCRLIQDTTLWTCMAVLATQAKLDGLDTAEEAYAAINQPDKVMFIQRIKNLNKPAQKLAEIALLSGSTSGAETILLHNGLVYQAINLNIQMHNWNRALELAVKHKTHVDTVLFLRDNYLKTIQKEENNGKFLKLKEAIQVDEAKIIAKIKLENAS